MKWINHLAIVATTALVNPALVPVALLGLTAPDWLEWVREIWRRVRHRTLTHIVLYWVMVLGFALLLWDFKGVLSGIRVGWAEPCAGGFVHGDGYRSRRSQIGAFTCSAVHWQNSLARRFSSEYWCVVLTTALTTRCTACGWRWAKASVTSNTVWRVYW